MNTTKKNILLTGPPGIGKTTLIKKLSEGLSSFCPVGFYTEEIRIEGIRKGFDLISLNGKRGLLSHVEIKSPYRVGKYRVDVKGFEEFLNSIAFFAPAASLIIIDEIGKMECLSSKFRGLIREVLDSSKILIATVAFKGGGIIKEIKKRNDIRLFEITQKNRESLLSEIVKGIKGHD